MDEKAKSKIRRHSLDRRPVPQLACYEPDWSGSFIAWAKNFARTNLWRVAPNLDFDDLLQELAVKFIEVRAAYVVDDPPHFMRLFQTACRNHVHDLAKRRRRELPIVSEGCEDSRLVDAVPCRFDSVAEAEFRVIIDAAPLPIRNICFKALEGSGGYRRLLSGGLESRYTLLRRLAGLNLARRGQEHIEKMFFRWYQKEFRGDEKSVTSIPGSAV